MVIAHDPNKSSNPIPGFQMFCYSDENRSNVLIGSNAYKAYHVSCLELALPAYKEPGHRLDRDIWGATIQESIWETSLASVERLRVDWLIERFAHRMARFPPIFNLPVEILRKIGRDCLREEAVMELKRLWLRKKKDPTAIHIDVDETSTLWIRYTKIEGLKIVGVFISSDRLGIREIHIMRPGDMPTVQPAPGVGWNIYRTSAVPLLFKGHFDGLKLRRLRILELNQLDIKFCPSGRIRDQTWFRDLLWSTIPNENEILPNNGPLIHIDRSQGDYQQLSNIVQHIYFNKPNTSGYSFCGYRDTLIEIIPNDSESLPFDIAHTEGGLFPLWWMYLSLDEGERISELWKRIYFTGSRWGTTLIMGHDGLWDKFVTIVWEQPW
ncbi:hypothetical protein ACHAPM_010395 [Fusarium culmorum]